MLDWLACRFAPRLVPLTACSPPELPEPLLDGALSARAAAAFAALDAVPFTARGPTNPFRLLLGMGCRDLVGREADQHPGSAGRGRGYEAHPAFQPLEIPLEGGPTLTGHHSLGPPGAPIVIVVHGIFDSHTAFYVIEYAESLRRFGFHVVALDLRDHGRLLGGSLRPALGIEEGRDLFRAARALARSEGVSVGILGISYGGQCAVRAAYEASLAGEAELLRGGVMTLCAPLDMQEALLAFDDRSRLPRPPALLDRLVFSGLLATMERHLKLRAPGVRLPSHEAWVTYVREVLLPANPDQPALVGAFLGKARSTQASIMGALAVPTAIVHSQDDPLVPVVHARRALSSAGGNAWVHVRELPLGGHVGLGAVDGPGTLGMLAAFFGSLRDG